MKNLLKPVLAAGLAAAALSTVPASAQVSGNIAVVNAPEVVLRSSALQAAYQQIDTTYATQRTTIQQRGQQRQTLLGQIDTNGDKQVDDAELQAAQGTPALQQIEQLENEIAQNSGQIERARVYAIEQILLQYANVLQTTIQQNSIQLILTPDTVIYAQPAADISEKVLTALNTAAPSVAIAAPADWQPSRQSVAMYQQVQQALMAVQAQRAAQAQQQQATQPAPTGR